MEIPFIDLTDETAGVAPTSLPPIAAPPEASPYPPLTAEEIIRMLAVGSSAQQATLRRAYLLL